MDEVVRFLHGEDFSEIDNKILFLRGLGEAYKKIQKDWIHGDSVYPNQYYLNDKGVLSKVVRSAVEIEFVAKITKKLEKAVTELGLPFDKKKIIRWKIDEEKK